jgi:hypothetical protein|tara:strand:- start:403 stop:567 length:165 start_codon:yes stop_codon:yes gene_type:complete
MVESRERNLKLFTLTEKQLILKEKRLIKDRERNLRMVLAKDIEEEEFRYILGRR